MHDALVYQRVFETCPIALLVSDAEGRITAANTAATELIGTEAAALIGQPFDDLIQLRAEAMIANRPDDVATLATDRPERRVRAELLHGGAVRRAVEVVSRALVDAAGTRTGAVHVLRDVMVEEQLLQSKDGFLYDVAHELQTPLTALHLSIDYLLHDLPRLGQQERRLKLASLQRGVARLRRLIDNLLDAGSIQAGTFEIAPEPAALDACVRDAIHTVQPMLDRKGQSATLTVSGEPPIADVDPRRLGQVLINLLSNASKYSPDHAEITVEVGADATTGHITVTDCGPGIPLVEVDHIFRRFYRSKQIRDGSGIGLGLAIVKAIVEAHHGAVGVRTGDNGTSVWIELPLVRPTVVPG